MLKRAGRVVAAALLLGTAAAPAGAQFVPYYGKNKITYDRFAWRIYRSPHFEVYYYPEFEQHLSRLVSYAESAYQKISGDLKHEIPFAIPVIFYKTHSEFEQTNLFPAFVPEGVLAFAEPVRNRLVVPIDLSPDALQGLITHELTHIFEFDIIPRSLVRRDVPLWVDEGLADYMRGTWDTLDLMTLRDAAVADQVPRLSKPEQLEAFPNPRVVYNLGHAAFEFMEARFGKEGIRQFLYTMRKNTVGGGLDDVFQQAFRMKAEDFDEAFEKWLRERFKPYRDRQRPTDWGRNLAPDPEKGSLTQVLAFAPSPSGELVAALVGNRSEGEVDVVLLSTGERGAVKNLTGGFTGQYESITLSDEFTAGRSLDFSPQGDAVAFFARRGKGRSLFVVSVLTGKVIHRHDVPLDQAQGPAFLPDGSAVVFSALREGVADVYRLDLATGEVRNLTGDAYHDSDPRVSPDGTMVAYTRRVSGHDKVYLFPLADPARKVQLTFGVHDDRAPSFSPDGGRLYYSSNEDDDTFNVRSLDLRTGVVRQYTEALGGAMAPAALPGPGAERLAFVTYFKGEYGLHALENPEPLREVDQEVSPVDAEIVDFQPDLVHQVMAENKRRKKLFEKLFLEGRPPLNVGVTSNGDFFGGSQVALSDVLGDKNLVVTASSVREYRTYDGTYVDLGGRLHWGLSLFDSTRYFFPTFMVQQSLFSREGAFATQRFTGGTLLAEYPLDKFRRLQGSVGVVRVNEEYTDPLVEQTVRDLAAESGAAYPLRRGTLLPVGLELVQETTRFAGWGPLSGSTFSVGVRAAPGLGGALSNFTVDVDLRKYLRLTSGSLLAARFRGFRSSGDNPEIFYFGGNMEMRGYPYLSFSGHEGFFAALELRVPIIDVMKTPIGLLGPVRGTLFGNLGAARYAGEDFTFSTRDPGVSYVRDEVFGEETSGLRLVDGRASYGFGLQFFFLGYPLHFDFSKLTDLQVSSEGWKFDFWMGFDF